MRLLALTALVLLRASAVSADSFVLAEHCPPSFDRGEDGRCHLASLYQLYVAAPGQGGLRVPLPEMKGSFTPQQIDLGRLLFFDPALSGDGRVSCAHCHHPDLGYADGRRTAMGGPASGIGPARDGGVELPRNSPTLWNVGFLGRLFWDGRAASLQEQAAGPLFAADEMASTPEHVRRTLSANATYRQLFAQAFDRSSNQQITVDEVTTALAAFQSSLISLNSRFDRYAHGDERALSEAELRGWNVFRGFVGRCAQCHIPPLFSSDDLAVVGAPPVPGQPYDQGAGALAPMNAALKGAFKVPTLRNVTLTAPYFQAGQFATLSEVLDFYNSPRGHALPAGAGVELHWHIHMKESELSAADVADVLEFLNALTDTSMAPQVPAAVPSGLPVVPRLH
ncbi:cytochrome-c peroxidase [Steroidobacter sp.]|uniref:cytochrome-c peroxidase n=1 Tax=Steroidobacter sp. TaxID=1978227 RepID=UPI002EDAF0FE